MTEVKLGANCWNQYTTWADLREAGVRADRLGFDSVWTWDHLYPIVGDHEGPIFEAYMTMAAWAEATERATIGLMVGANTFRNPAVVAKQITALDHISNGRAVLGIGGAWFETEHEGLGIEFGRSPGERLNWLDEAVQILRGMLDGTRPSGSKFYNATDALNLPLPVQKHLPILVGGGGERKTLRLVAQYADACNIFDRSPEFVRAKLAILREHCDRLGRPYEEIERTVLSGIDLDRESADETVERFGQLGEAGAQHVIFSVFDVFDPRAMEVLSRDVIPQLHALV